MHGPSPATSGGPPDRKGVSARAKWALAFALFAAGIAYAIVQATQVELRQKSSPAGIVSRNAYHDVGSTVSVPAPPMQSAGYRFAYWQLNGVRQTDSFGISLTALNFRILEGTDAVAVYIREDLDSDGDGIPDFYEWFQYGALSYNATSDTDGDGVSLLEEYTKGSQPRIPDSAADGGVLAGGISRRRGELLAVTVGPDYHLYEESSTPPGVVSRRQYLKDGTRITTANLGGDHQGHRFTQWKVNGVRQENASGIALSQVNLVISEATRAVAEYVPIAQDSDGDGIPDWYELLNYGTLAVSPTEDTDGDGRTLSDEFKDGTQPRIPDSASDGSIVEGGVSRRRGEKLSLAFSPDYFRYTETSVPPGITAKDTYVLKATPVSTLNAPPEVSGYRFGQWLVNGVRQESPAGIAISQVSFPITADTQAVACYYPASADSDGDGIPDWYEMLHYGTLANKADSDSDADGVSLLDELTKGSQPRIPDSAADGGLVEGGVSRRRGERLVLNLQFFPTSQVPELTGGGFFTDAFNGAPGSFKLATQASFPALGDIDGDGDLDLLLGGGKGAVRLYRNTGSPFAPILGEVGNLGNLGKLTNWPTGGAYPALGDWSGNGRRDLVVGSDDGVLRFYKAQSGTYRWVQDTAGARWEFLPSVQGTPLFVYAGELKVGTGAVHPAFWNKATGPDLLVLDGVSGKVLHFQKVSGAIPYANPPASDDLFPGELIPGGLSLSAVDSDGDGLVDILASDAEGRIWQFLAKKTGGFTLQSKVWGGSFNGFRPGLSATVTDFDGDGLPDVIGGGSDGAAVFLKNPGERLRLTPAISTLTSGGTLELSSIDDDGTLVWSLGVNRSGGTLTVSGSQTAGKTATAVFTAGPEGGIDQVVATNGAGRSGVAWVNVVPEEAGTRHKWRALLVDGRRTANDPVWPASEALTARAVEVLKYRGLAPGDILRLGYDDSSAARPTRKALMGALRDGEAVDANTETLVVFLADHGRISANGDGLFVLSKNETVSGSELNEWANALQANRPNLSVVVVVECCYAARVTEQLAKAGAYSSRRLVLSSTGRDELSHLAANGLVSYSMMWWNAVASGKTMQEAQTVAAEAMAGLQTPQLGSGGTALLARKVGLDTIADSGRPVVSIVGGDQVLKGVRETTIRVSVNSPLALDRVFGIVVPPGYEPSGEAPVMSLPEVDLALDASTGLWSANLGGFTESGAPYTVLVQAQDVWGAVSSPAVLHITQETVRNRVIIFATGGAKWRNAGDAAKLANYAWAAALQRRVAPEDIKVIISQGTSLKGTASATANDLKDAILNWSNADGRLGILSVFIVGAGTREGVVCSDGSVLTPAKLKEWLDILQSRCSATVQLIVDADYSGIFVKGTGNPTKPRILISSTDSGQENNRVNGRWSSFSNWLWDGIARGRDLRESYDEALELAARSGQDTRAQFDDSGDGEFNRAVDGVRSVNAFLGSAYVTADDPPFIWKASASQQVATGGTARFYVAEIMMPDGSAPESVWGDVIGPDGSNRAQVKLWWNLAKERYEGVFRGFAESGRYVVFVRAGTEGDPSRTTPPAVVQIYYGSQQNLGSPATTYLPALSLPTDGQTMNVETGAGGAWRIELKRGQRVLIETLDVSPKRDVALQLAGAGSRVLVEANRWGEGFGEAINGWEVPESGSYVVRAVFGPGNGAGKAYCKIRASVRYDALWNEPASGLQQQTLTFAQPANRVLSEGTLLLQATASSNLSPRFELLGGQAELSGSSLRPLAAGTLVVRALQDGNALFDSAEPVERSFQVLPAAETYESWARRMFGDQYATKGGLTQDPDGDGHSNEAEWLARTDPTSAADCLRISSTSFNNDRYTLRWLSRLNVKYRVMISADLVSWAPAATANFTGTGAELEFVDAISNTSERYYRVEVVP
jgi:hypothetical protein